MPQRSIEPWTHCVRISPLAPTICRSGYQLPDCRRTPVRAPAATPGQEQRRPASDRHRQLPAHVCLPRHQGERGVSRGARFGMSVAEEVCLPRHQGKRGVGRGARFGMSVAEEVCLPRHQGERGVSRGARFCMSVAEEVCLPRHQGERGVSWGVRFGMSVAEKVWGVACPTFTGVQLQ